MDIIWWAVIGLVVVGCYFWYATIVKRKTRVFEALAGIDVQLQQRHDLIPNVLTIARRFMDHERGLLAEITELRTKAHQQVGERDFAKVAEKFETEARLAPADGPAADAGRELSAAAFRRPDDRGAAHLHRDRDQHRGGPPVLQREREPHSPTPCKRFLATC